MDTRLGELKGSLDGLRHGYTILAAGAALIAGVMAWGFSNLNSQTVQLNGKLDAIPKTLSEEFRAMRAEMGAQTNTIATSITAARQMQPAPAPQVVIVPSPQPAPEPPKP